MRNLISVVSILFSLTAAASLPMPRSVQGDAMQVVFDTNADSWLAFRVHTSHAIDDTFCQFKHQSVEAWAHPDHEDGLYLGLIRANDFHRVLYEWHICLEVDGTMYRGWRGFDLGPDTTLTINCMVDTHKINALDEHQYFCQAQNAITQPANYNEAAEYCWQYDRCRRFESASSYQKFIESGVGDVASEVMIGPMVVQQKEVLYEDQNFDSGYPWGLSDSFLESQFSQLNGLAKTAVSGNMWRGKHHDFEPHIVQGDVVSYYSVNCKRIAQGKANCQLTLNEAFYAGDPKAHFEIDSTTQVDQAKSVYKQFELPDTHHANSYDNYKQYVQKITIKDDVAVIAFGSGRCHRELRYRVPDDNEALEYLGKGSYDCK